MVTAARVAASFGLDPVVVADEANQFRKAFRVAAHNVLVEDANRR